ncbi:MAG: hypothetical protein ACTHKZ_08110, partial [Lysobacteraceae bacterium]
NAAAAIATTTADGNDRRQAMRNNENSNRGGNRGDQGSGNRGSGGNTRNASGSGDMSVREAGHMGGQRERELVQQGKQAEGSGRGRNSNNDR